MKQKWENCNDTSVSNLELKSTKLPWPDPQRDQQWKYPQSLHCNQIKYINERNFIGFGEDD